MTTTKPKPKPEGYDYIERIIAPSVVEFYVQTPQGHRVVTIFLDSHNPRIRAYNESSSRRSPATLYLQEVLSLIERANWLVNSHNVPDTTTSNPDGDNSNEDR